MSILDWMTYLEWILYPDNNINFPGFFFVNGAENDKVVANQLAIKFYRRIAHTNQYMTPKRVRTPYRVITVYSIPLVLCIQQRGRNIGAPFVYVHTLLKKYKLQHQQQHIVHHIICSSFVGTHSTKIDCTFNEFLLHLPSAWRRRKIGGGSNLWHRTSVNAVSCQELSSHHFPIRTVTWTVDLLYRRKRAIRDWMESRH